VGAFADLPRAPLRAVEALGPNGCCGDTMGEAGLGEILWGEASGVAAYEVATVLGIGGRFEQAGSFRGSHQARALLGFGDWGRGGLAS